MSSESTAGDDENATPAASNAQTESASTRATREKLIHRHPALFEKSRALLSLQNERSVKTNVEADVWNLSEDVAAKLEKKLLKLEDDMSQIKFENIDLKLRVEELEQEKQRLQFDNERLLKLLQDSEKNLLSTQLDIEILKEQRELWRENLISSAEDHQRERLKDKSIRSNLVEAVTKLAQHTMQLQLQNATLDEELRFERQQLHDLYSRWEDLKAAMEQHRSESKENESFPHSGYERLQLQLEQSNDQIQYLEALTATQAEVEIGHVELATELQIELDEKDAEISILYRTLRTLQKHMHRLYSEAQRSRELIGILQRENTDLLHSMQRLEDRQVELCNQSKEKSHRNVHLLRLLRQTQRTQIQHHLRQLECIQLQHRLKIAEMRIPPMFIVPNEAASTNAFLLLHRIMFKSRLVIGQLDSKLSSSEITAEFHLSCFCARLCARLQSLAHQALIFLSKIDLDSYYRAGSFSGELLSCEVACDSLLHLLGDDMLTVDFDTSSLRSACDMLTSLVTELQSLAGTIDNCEHIVQASLSRVYFHQLEQSAIWEEFRNKLVKPLSCDDNVWRISVTTNLDNMFAAYSRALSASRVAFQEADSRAGLFLRDEECFQNLISELNSLSDRADDAVKAMNTKMDPDVCSSADSIVQLFNDYHDDLIMTFGRISYILSEVVTWVMHTTSTENSYNIFCLRIISAENQPPWERCATEIKGQLEESDLIRLAMDRLQAELLESKDRCQALVRDLQAERLRSGAFSEKLEVLKARELQYQAMIQDLKSHRDTFVEIPKQPHLAPNLSAILDADRQSFFETDASVLRLRRLVRELRHRLDLSKCKCKSSLSQRVRRELPSLQSVPTSCEPGSESLQISGAVLHLLSTPKLVSIHSDRSHNLVRDQHYRQCLRVRAEMQEQSRAVSLRNDLFYWTNQLQSQPCFDLYAV